MSMCSCAPSSLTSVTFDHGISLLRCAHHEQQAWSVHGQALERTEALETLREVFYERRGQRREVAAAQVAAAAAPATPVRGVTMTPDKFIHLSGRQADETLTALLQARGISGAWAIA